MPFGWTFDQTVFNLSAGRRIRLMPFDITNAFDASYTWSVNGKQVQQSSDPVYISPNRPKERTRSKSK